MTPREALDLWLEGNASRVMFFNWFVEGVTEENAVEAATLIPNELRDDWIEHLVDVFVTPNKDMVRIGHGPPLTHEEKMAIKKQVRLLLKAILEGA